jgi:hypothetical protein
MALFDIISQYFPGRIEDSRCHARDSNRSYRLYKAEAPPFDPSFSVRAHADELFISYIFNTLLVLATSLPNPSVAGSRAYFWIRAHKHLVQGINTISIHPTSDNI